MQIRALIFPIFIFLCTLSFAHEASWQSQSRTFIEECYRVPALLKTLRSIEAKIKGQEITDDVLKEHPSVVEIITKAEVLAGRALLPKERFEVVKELHKAVFAKFRADHPRNPKPVCCRALARGCRGNCPLGLPERRTQRVAENALLRILTQRKIF